MLQKLQKNLFSGRQSIGNTTVLQTSKKLISGTELENCFNYNVHVFEAAFGLTIDPVLVDWKLTVLSFFSSRFIRAANMSK